MVTEYEYSKLLNENMLRELIAKTQELICYKIFVLTIIVLCGNFALRNAMYNAEGGNGLGCI